MENNKEYKIKSWKWYNVCEIDGDNDIDSNIYIMLVLDGIQLRHRMGYSGAENSVVYIPCRWTREDDIVLLYSNKDSDYSTPWKFKLVN
jgi:hypothetical protein